MKKKFPVVEIALAVILVVSMVVFFMMPEKNDTGGDISGGIYDIETVDEDKGLKYDFRTNISKEDFEKYQIKEIGETADFHGDICYFPGSLTEGLQRGIEGQRSITLKSVEVKESFDGKEAKEGYLYVIVNLTETNLLGEDYLWTSSGLELRVADEYYDYQEEADFHAYREIFISDDLILYKEFDPDPPHDGQHSNIYYAPTDDRTSFDKCLFKKDSTLDMTLYYEVQKEYIINDEYNLMWGKNSGVRYHKPDRKSLVYTNRDFWYKIKDELKEQLTGE